MIERTVTGKICKFDVTDWASYLIYGYSVRSDGEGYNSLILCGGKYRHKVFARILLNAPDNLIVDHRDGNPLNNCRDNLRLVTASQSMMNRYSTGECKYKGVYKNRNGFSSSIMLNRQKIYLGYFDTQEQAAKAYQAAAEKYFGAHAVHLRRSETE